MGALENTLTQADIDALMRSLLPANGDDLFQGKNDQALRDYDFRRPTKFKKDLLRTLVMVHDNYARLLQSFFLASLRTSVQVVVRGTNQYLYAEYTQLLPTPAVVAVVRLNPLPGLCLIEISSNIAFAIIDRVFGGPGSDVQPQRGLSEIELSVVQRTIQDMFGPLQEAWRNVADIRPVLETMEINPAFLQTSSPSEVLATMTLAVQIGEHSGNVTLVFPYSTVAPVMSKLSPHRWLADDQANVQADDEGLQDSIQEAPVSMTVQLGTARITVGEFTGLQVGDVIPLETRLNDDLMVYAGNVLTFHGRPGVVGNRLAIQVTKRVAAPQG
ncbi:MAG TPA: flagellar motor switch protein FliM [Symbiobacteriaceae bacterium]|nr:flagellar motor switch protein FliM [Symbiobacteriaceae bacterium]